MVFLQGSKGITGVSKGLLTRRLSPPSWVIIDLARICLYLLSPCRPKWGWNLEVRRLGFVYLRGDATLLEGPQ